MVDTSIDLVIERVNSVKDIFYEEVPEDTVFTFKFKDKDGKSFTLFEYNLTKGKELPYTTTLKERRVTFSNMMKPGFAKMKIFSKDDVKKSYVFQDLDESSDVLSSVFDDSFLSNNQDVSFGGLNDSLVFKSASLGLDDSTLSDPGKEIARLERIECHREEVTSSKKKLEDMLKDLTDHASLAPFKCAFCANRYDTLLCVTTHVEGDHPDWKSKVNSPSSEVSTNLGDLESSSAVESGNSGSSHSNSNWFGLMRSSFQEAVVGNCKKITRDAFEANENVTNIADRRTVRNDLINETVAYLKGIFKEDNLRKKNAVKVADLLGDKYPAMFKDDSQDDSVPSFVGYGLGGLKGVKGLPDQLCDRYRDREGGRKSKKTPGTAETEMDENAPPTKKVKKPLVYGVSQKKWYDDNIGKNAVEALRTAGSLGTFEEQEKVFDQNRPALTKNIRNSQKMISKACPGLFDDPRHLQGQFLHLTGENIAAKVERNIVGHLENMEEYLISMNTSLEFSNQLDKIKEDCDILFMGAKTHKYIHLLRLAADHFDGDGSSLVRIESDGPPKSSSPFINAIRVGTNYVFELHVEKSRILEKMDLAGSISALLHLVFCFNLKYAKGSETVCDFLQRQVAHYGDEDGTRTNKSRSSAETKMTKYLIQLGRILGAKNVK